MIVRDVESMNISLDNFSRTTDEKHYEIAVYETAICFARMWGVMETLKSKKILFVASPHHKPLISEAIRYSLRFLQSIFFKKPGHVVCKHPVGFNGYHTLRREPFLSQFRQGAVE